MSQLSKKIGTQTNLGLKGNRMVKHGNVDARSTKEGIVVSRDHAMMSSDGVLLTPSNSANKFKPGKGKGIMNDKHVHQFLHDSIQSKKTKNKAQINNYANGSKGSPKGQMITGGGKTNA